MNKQKLLKIVNPLLGVCFLGVAGTGVLHDLIPPEIYYVAHPLWGYCFVGFALLHVVLNWSWIKSNYLAKKKKAA